MPRSYTARKRANRLSRDHRRPRLSQQAEDFIQKVLTHRPRTAVFDCDGTLWAGDAGEDFLFWEIKNRLLPEGVARSITARCARYKDGKISEEQMCGEMVTIHRGLRVEDVERAAARFVFEVVEGRIYTEMQELIRRLAQMGCQLWAISSTNQWVINAGLTHFVIPPEHVVAASAAVDGDVITDRLLRVPTGDGKAQAIRELIGPRIDAAFGNSIHDVKMLEMAERAYAIAPTGELNAIAYASSWQIYCPQ